MSMSVACSLESAEGLVDHHLAVGQGVAHTLLARAEEEGSHAGGAAMHTVAMGGVM